MTNGREKGETKNNSFSDMDRSGRLYRKPVGNNKSRSDESNWRRPAVREDGKKKYQQQPIIR